MKTEADLEELVRGVVAQVVGDGTAGVAAGTSLRGPVPTQPPLREAPPPTEAPVGDGVIRVSPTGQHGMFSTVDDAVDAARKAQGRLAGEGLDKRRAYVEA
ncbi:MAG: hypothetical protein HYU54_07505, partial [Actinobacteria bacterium]|nr:hypothetical protein [Actinomycetota bacterium]